MRLHHFHLLCSGTVDRLADKRKVLLGSQCFLSAIAAHMRAPLGKKEAEDERRRKMFFAVTFFPDSFFRRVRDVPKENSCGLRLFVLFFSQKSHSLWLCFRRTF